MMRNTLKIMMGLLFLLPLSLLQAAPVLKNTVKFDHPEKFTDFEDRRYSSERGRQSLIADFEPKLIRVLGQSLPEGNTMQIVFTDIDMAGWISPMSAPDFIRVIRTTDKARLEFHYQWFDAQGKLVKEGKVNLLERNLRFLKNQTRKYNNSNLSYELVMMERWVRELTE